MDTELNQVPHLKILTQIREIVSEASVPFKESAPCISFLNALITQSIEAMQNDKKDEKESDQESTSENPGNQDTKAKA